MKACMRPVNLTKGLQAAFLLLEILMLEVLAIGIQAERCHSAKPRHSGNPNGVGIGRHKAVP